MAEPIRVELEGALAGHHVLLDPDALTWGMLEDLESGKHLRMIDAVVGCLVGGDLPHGTDRDGLRKLKVAEVPALMKGVGEAFQVPKS